MNNHLYEEETKNNTTLKEDEESKMARTRNIELIIKRSPKLILDVVESQTLPKGHLVTLNAFGIENQ